MKHVNEKLMVPFSWLVAVVLWAVPSSGAGVWFAAKLDARVARLEEHILGAAAAKSAKAEPSPRPEARSWIGPLEAQAAR